MPSDEKSSPLPGSDTDTQSAEWAAEQSGAEPIRPEFSGEPAEVRDIELQLHLHGGHVHTLKLREDSSELRDFFAAFSAPNAADGLVQLPTNDGETACSFRISQLVSVLTTPPVLIDDPGTSHSIPRSPLVDSLTTLGRGLWGLEGVLSQEECAVIMESSRPRLERATVAIDSDVYGEAGSGVGEARTNSFASFEANESIGPEFDAAVAKVRELVCDLTDLPRENQEPIQVLHYAEGQKFDAHFDAFGSENQYGRWESTRGGARLSTFIVYLNHVEQGGETEFPQLGVTITPAPGRAGFWHNIADGLENPDSIHEAHPVVRGEKWALVIWVRESSFLSHPVQSSDDVRCIDWINTPATIGAPEWIDEQTAEAQLAIPHLGAGGPECRGFEKRRMDDAIFSEILDKYQSLKPHLEREDNEAVGSFVDTVSREFPAALFREDQEFSARVLDLLKPLHEDWCGFELMPSACYGFRVYLPGSYLHNHVDRTDTHVISSTLCVDRDVYAPWYLHAVDVDGNEFDVDYGPGEHVLYESARVSHGRPVPLNGRYHVGMFIHYRPAQDYDLWVTAPKEWRERYR